MKLEYPEFKKTIFEINDSKCLFCGGKAIHIIHLDPIHNIYSCLGFKLNFKEMKSVCLRCYYKKLNSISKKMNHHQSKRKNKK